MYIWCEFVNLPRTSVALIRRAAEFYRLAASWDHVDSAYELAYLYAQGTGVERNVATAAKYLSIVAQVWLRLSNTHPMSCHQVPDKVYFIVNDPQSAWHEHARSRAAYDNMQHRLV